MISWQMDKGPGWFEELTIQHVGEAAVITTHFYYEPENESFETTVEIPVDQFRKLLKQMEIEFGSTQRP